MNDILHCPSISKNLLSINKLCRDNPYYVQFDDTSIFIKDRRSNDLVVEGYAQNGLYRLDLDDRKVSAEVNFAEKVLMQLCHRLLGFNPKGYDFK